MRAAWVRFHAQNSENNDRIEGFIFHDSTIYDRSIEKRDSRQIPLNLDKGKPGESQRRKAKGAKADKPIRYASQLPKDAAGCCLRYGNPIFR